jgi:hypothetical protein
MKMWEFALAVLAALVVLHALGALDSAWNAALGLVRKRGAAPVRHPHHHHRGDTSRSRAAATAAAPAFAPISTGSTGNTAAGDPAPHQASAALAGTTLAGAALAPGPSYSNLDDTEPNPGDPRLLPTLNRKETNTAPHLELFDRDLKLTLNTDAARGAALQAGAPQPTPATLLQR